MWEWFAAVALIVAVLLTLCPVVGPSGAALRKRKLHYIPALFAVLALWEVLDASDMSRGWTTAGLALLAAALGVAVLRQPTNLS